MQISGILLSQTGLKEELAHQSIKFGQLLQALISIDPNIIILPYSCDVEHIHKALVLLKSPQDSKALTDICLTNWGNPSKNNGRLALSFYIGSTIVTEDLSALKNSKPFQTFLSSSKFNMYPHYLHQTESKRHSFPANLQNTPGGKD